MKKLSNKNDYIILGLIILMLILFIAAILVVSYFASTHTIVKIINESNWKWIALAHIGALLIWTFIICGGIHLAIVDDIKEPKLTLKRRILIPFRILALFLVGLFVFWIFIIDDVIPTSKDLITNQIATYKGCYRLDMHDPAKGPNEYYLIPQNSFVPDPMNETRIVISPEDYQMLNTNQNCKRTLQIRYLPNLKLRINWELLVYSQ